MFFNLLIFFFKKNLNNFFKYFFLKKNILYVLTNFHFYYNLIFFLKKSTFFQLKNLTDIIIVDFPYKFYRFLVSYFLLSLKFNFRLNVYLCVNELNPLMTIKNLFLAANWLEREIWDFYGIFFLFNNDLRRIFSDYGFNGYPLRKDFPLYGYSEMFYDDSFSSIIYTDVKINRD